MMHVSGRILRKRFLTKEEKGAWDELQRKKRQEEIIKDRREARKAKKKRELKKRRAKELMQSNLRKCEPEFRYIVQQWCEGKTVAHVNRFFRYLEEFKCPMEPCYNPKKLEPAQKVLRKNKCGYKELINGMYLYDVVDCSEWEWNTIYTKVCERAHELHFMLCEMA